MKRARTETHDFFCLNCGKSMPLARRASAQREKMHRKKLFCPFCKNIVNMVECKDYSEKLIFIDNFNKGIYKEEARISMEVCKNG